MREKKIFWRFYVKSKEVKNHILRQNWIFRHTSCINRSSRPELFLGKGVLKICSKFTGEHPCRSAISIKLQSSFIETTLWHECSPSNLLYIFRTPFPKNTSGWLLLLVVKKLCGRWGEDRSPLASPGSYCPVNSVARVSMWQILPENNLEIK